MTTARRRPWPGVAFVLLLALGAVFREPAPAAARTTAAIAPATREIAYGPDPAQRFDVYLPNTPLQAGMNGTPTIFYVHGGGWRRGECSRQLQDEHETENTVSPTHF